MKDDELITYLLTHNIHEYEAGELVTFLPTAFCRKFIPEFNWPLQYSDYYSEKKNKSKENSRKTYATALSKLKQNGFGIALQARNSL